MTFLLSVFGVRLRMTICTVILNGVKYLKIVRDSSTVRLWGTSQNDKVVLGLVGVVHALRVSFCYAF